MGLKEEYKKQAEAEEPYRESSDESFAMDMAQGGQRLPSNITPEDYYQYKRFINLPESQAEHLNKIDKDVVMANLGGAKPTREELRFQEGTIELAESEWIHEVKIPRKNADGSLVRDMDGEIVYNTELVFDEYFRGCLNFLKGQYKFDLVGSRAMGGQDRAAFLDISSSNRISKEFARKKEQKNQFFGTGGGM